MTEEEQKKLYPLIIGFMKRTEIMLKQDISYLKHLKALCIEDEEYELIRFCERNIELNEELDFDLGSLLDLLPKHSLEDVTVYLLYTLKQHTINKNENKDAYRKQLAAQHSG
jgi:hypothetical protein